MVKVMGLWYFVVFLNRMKNGAGFRGTWSGGCAGVSK